MLIKGAYRRILAQAALRLLVDVLEDAAVRLAERREAVAKIVGRREALVDGARREVAQRRELGGRHRSNVKTRGKNRPWAHVWRLACSQMKATSPRPALHLRLLI